MGVSASGTSESRYLLLVGQNMSALGPLMQQLLPDTAKSVSNLSEESRRLAIRLRNAACVTL